MRELTVAVPAYNEEESVERVVEELLIKIPTFVEDFELLFVNDGSTDRTGEILDELAARHESVRVVHHDRNQGFPGVVFTLIRNTKKQVYTGISADGEVNVDDLSKMLDKIIEGYDVVIGVRNQKPNYNRYRKIVSWSYNKSVELLFGVNFRDIGSTKMYRTEVFKHIDTRSNSAFINAEYLVKASRLGYKIGFVDIVQRPRLGGTAKGAVFRSVRNCAIDLLRFWRDSR